MAGRDGEGRPPTRPSPMHEACWTARPELRAHWWCSRASWSQGYRCPTGGCVSALERRRRCPRCRRRPPSTRLPSWLPDRHALAMTEHAGTTAAVTTAATNRVSVRMLRICRQGPTPMTGSRAGNRALLKLAIRRPYQQPAVSRSGNSRRTLSSPNKEGTQHRTRGRLNLRATRGQRTYSRLAGDAVAASISTRLPPWATSPDPRRLPRGQPAPTKLFRVRCRRMRT